METVTAVPATAPACSTLLLQALQDRAGVIAAEYDAGAAQLVLHYDATAVPAGEAAAVADRLARDLATNLASCNGRGGVRCSTCSALVAAGAMPDPAAATVRGDRVSVRLQADPAHGALGRVERRVGAGPTAARAQSEQEESVRPQAIATVLCGIGLVAGYAAEKLGWPGWLSIALYAASCVAGGYYPTLDGIDALKGGVLDINFLMIAGAAGAAFLGRWSEGATLMLLFSLSGTLEGYAVGRTRHAIRALMNLSPESATVRRDGQEQQLPVADLRADDVMILHPGERIAADGTVMAGESAVNEAAITGESLPVDKAPHSAVYAGTVNGQGALEVRVTRLASESTLARIIRYVEEAQAQKASTQRLTDWIDRYYTLAVIGVALLAWVLPPLFGLDNWNHSFYRAMLLLVVASPCALVISTPAAILSGIARAARDGILFKGGLHLEQAGRVQVVALDKTGTLTSGTMNVVSVQPVPGVDPADLLRLAAAVESRSEHPLAAAIVRYARGEGIDFPVADDFQAVSGQGATATVDGAGAWAGSERMLEQKGIDAAALQAWAEANLAQGHTAIFAGTDRLLGGIALADVPRPGARGALAALKRLGVTRTVMLTGDNPRAAAAIAAQVGVDEVRAGLLPQDKLHVIKELEQKYGPVAMVGDGVNDAPALAAATVGVAMGGIGSDVAMETADLVLMADDLNKLARAIDIGRRARRTVITNLTFAIGVICTLVVLVLLGRLTLPFAVMGHEGSTILVAFNGLRLLLNRTQNT